MRPDGHHGIYGVVEMQPSIGVVALNDANEIALVTQWRYTLGRMSVEVPPAARNIRSQRAGGRATRASRGNRAVRGKLAGTRLVDNSNGVTNDVAHMFLATGLEAGADAQDPAEQVVLSWLPFGQAVDRVLKGSITESVSVAAILKVQVLLRRDPLSQVTPWPPA